jgi:hypothetical protein
MDKALVFGTKDCRFESCQDHYYFAWELSFQCNIKNLSVHFKIDAHTTSIAQYMHRTFIRWGCQPLETVKTVWPSGLRRWLEEPFRKGVGSNPAAVIFHRHTYISYNTSAYARHIAKIEFESMIMSFPSWHKGHHTQCYMSSKNTLAYYLSAGVSRAGARTWLQLTGHGDMQGFDSPSPAIRFIFRTEDTWSQCRSVVSIHGPLGYEPNTLTTAPLRCWNHWTMQSSNQHFSASRSGTMNIFH